MKSEALRGAESIGQSLWLDYLHRKFIDDGQLKALVTDGGISGVTSNPAIFEKAIAGDVLYSERISKLLAQRCFSASELYEAIAVDDIRAAAAVLRPVYDRTDGRDGFASLEVSPYLADDTAATIAEARRLWAALASPNVMIKVPATPAGIPAIEALIEDGINVNVTLLFSVDAYAKVAQAYLRGLERRADKGGDLSHVASVASFFVSRVDGKADNVLKGHPEAKALRGKAGVANAKCAFAQFLELSATARWQALAQKGAQPQRLLWASTSVKNPDYPELLYVEELLGPGTVNTLPPATYDAFKERGVAASRLGQGLAEAQAALAGLAAIGFSYADATDELLAEGVVLFQEAFDKLLASVEKRRAEFLGSRLNAMSLHLPASLTKAVEAEAAAWARHGNIRRLWHRDATLWTSSGEERWLGWLDVVAAGRAALPGLTQLARDVAEGGFTHLLLLGMGGSSLCVEVMAAMLGGDKPAPGRPQVHVLDSTSPDQIRAVEAALDLAKTLVVVASKSGSTLEPNILRDYFEERLQAVCGAAAPRQLVAITDPDSALAGAARAAGCRAVVLGVPSIGGRYSALSPYGLAPAALMGLDVGRLLDDAERMEQSCGPSVPPAVNPGVRLGLVLAVAAGTGRDKVTVVAGPGEAPFGAWLEQLLAESTGKKGRALIPVAGEALGAPSAYGNDRLFVFLNREDAPDEGRQAAVRQLEAAGHPVVWINLAAPYHLGQEFFRWEIATAVCGAVMRLNPFDQPDVEAAKDVTRDLASAYERTRQIPKERPAAEAGPLSVYGGPVVGVASVEAALTDFVQSVRPRDYLAVLAFLEMNPVHERELQQLRQLLHEQLHVATCLGFGPRFLHSTGQAYKGGPDTGCFLQVTAAPAADLPVPNKAYTFGLIQAFQAAGDLKVLRARGRRVLRVHVTGDVGAGLAQLTQTMTAVLKDVAGARS